ncbi:MET15-like protein [Mya arenaria]|uniref:MET15-like protein n=1 Tax=Mya arenaria TaxID=6604 RepID=A0ABY7E1H7_MYAAR|nr:12S rRNA N4-methylcytidine methyltransferase-like [Mya arenaria]XP_052798009.1 12S rRNA N4-methylcytidine methyltransferase-like [Mya arenaria]WAR03675.1 MET15-like protein [Mya arenaria]
MRSEFIQRLLVKKLCSRHFQHLQKHFICQTAVQMNDLHNTRSRPDVRGAFHMPVMKTEVVQIFLQHGCRRIADLTFGAGGHSRAILEGLEGSSILALDRDPLAYQLASQLQQHFPDRLTALEGRFSDLPRLLESQGVEGGSLDGLLMDLGASSMQMDTGQRGFALSLDGPLDMRMDADKLPDQPSAADVVNSLDESDLAAIFRKYAEEPRAHRIAHGIIQARAAYGRINTTKQLADIVENLGSSGLDKLGRYSHPATRIFQALRIFVNNELNELNCALEMAHHFLKLGGVCVAISFHSLEDRIVKRHFHEIDLDEEKSLSLKQKVRLARPADSADELQELTLKRWQPLFKKVRLPSEDEMASNPRSRSAKLRAAIKN